MRCSLCGGSGINNFKRRHKVDCFSQIFPLLSPHTSTSTNAAGDKNMKSKIKIDVDNDGLSVIEMEVSMDISDLRDKMVKRFIENQGYDSSLLHFVRLSSEGDLMRYRIRPIKEISNDNDAPGFKMHLWELIAKSLHLKYSPTTTDDPGYWYDSNHTKYQLTIFGFEKMSEDPSQERSAI